MNVDDQIAFDRLRKELDETKAEGVKLRERLDVLEDTLALFFEAMHEHAGEAMMKMEVLRAQRRAIPPPGKKRKRA